MRINPPRGLSAVNNIILDSQGLSVLIQRDQRAFEWLSIGTKLKSHVLVNAVTTIEAIDPRMSQAAVDWALSRLTVVPLSPALARQSRQLLQSAGRHGHQYALDSVVCATAMEQPGVNVILTSDPKDLRSLLATTTLALATKVLVVAL